MLITSSHPSPGPKPEASPTDPPHARTVDTVETLFGVLVADPYRWMEGDRNKETDDWLRAQGAHTRAWLARLQGHDALLARIRELGLGHGFPRRVQLAGGRIFHYELAPGDQLPKLMLREPDGKARVLVDPATRGSRGTHASINNFAPSPNGSLVGYLISEGGSEISTLHVLDVDTGQESTEILERIWGEFAPCWLPDGKGFFYTQMAAPASGVDLALNMQVRLHHLGKPVDRDLTVFAGGHAASMKLAPEEFPIVVVPPGSSWMLALGTGAQSEVRVAVARLVDLDRSGRAATPWVTVSEYEDGIVSAVLHGDRLYLLSHKNASGRRVLSVPLAAPDLANACVEIEEDPEAPLVRIAAALDALYAERMNGGRASVLRLPWGAKRATALALPYAGWTNELVSDPTRDGVTFDLVGWTRPVTFFVYIPGAAKPAPVLTSIYAGDYSGIVADEVEATSADGTRVPLSILYRDDLAFDGSHPGILYGYGGYGIPMMPAFNSMILAWLERGGMIAVAHVRGGGEKGRAWQIAGTGEQKMNSIRDFIACGEYLVEKGYTSASRLACSGSSMGGVLVGRAITVRPDLFAAALITAGVVNPLRILAAENGANQKAELGDPETDKGFRAIYEMDPYQHVQPGTAYPAVLLAIGLNDRRVAPWMTAKMAARLQVSTTSGKPVLIRIDADAGHGVGSTRDQEYALRADVWSFLLAAAGDPAFQPRSP